MRISPLLSLLCLSVVTDTHANLFYVSQLEPVTPSLPIAPFEQGKATTFSFGMSRTEGKNSYSPIGTAVPFFEQLGTVQISDIYKGLPTRSSGTINDYFTTGGSHSLINKGADVPVDAQLRFQDKHNGYLFNSYHAALTHYLFSGLFIRGQAQFVDQTITQKPNASGPDADLARTTSFINDFDRFLHENNHPSVSYNNRVLTIERAGLFLGWTGAVALTRNFIQELSGSIMAGFTAAPSLFDQPLAPAFLLHGFTHGYSAQLQVCAQVFQHAGIDFALATTSHGRFSDSMHIVRDDTSASTLYSGPPVLGMGTVRKDPGSIWVMEAAISANRFKGFYVSGGYHFAYQEATQLTLTDSTVLLGSTWTPVHLSNLPGKQNTRLNSDPRLARWKHHTFFVRAGYTPAPHNRIVPHFDIAVHFPVLGMRSVCPSRIYTGSAQLSIRWTF